jgi:hypothetical protein
MPRWLELVDTLDSKSSAFKGVRVRIPLAAPKKHATYTLHRSNVRRQNNGAYLGSGI